jgi:hypothetical protein
MPYINEAQRRQVSAAISELLKTPPVSVGELNYLFSIIAKEWIDNHGLNYSSVNDLVGVLECCKMELYRRVAAPYEDQKRREHGDVY